MGRGAKVGIVFDIQRFAIHDGPGIRTTVFLKGCPLECPWCHNPEAIDPAPEISFMPERCVVCMYCVEACPHGRHEVEDGVHVYDRDDCRRCGICARKCYAQALEVIGKEMSANEVLDEVVKDKPFYETSGGGMTVSGGEPMAQPEFTRELLQRAKQNGLHTCLDTCGYTSFEHYERLIDLVDIFLWDLKETHSARHREHVGVGNESIVENMKKVDEQGGKLILRCLVIPGFNDRDDHFSAIAATGNSMKNIQAIHVLPYHPLGKGKSARLGRAYPLEDLTFPEEDTINDWLQRIQSHTSVPVTRS